MTENELINALESCIKNQCANCCNCGNWHEQWNCMTDLMKKALTIIKELATENEMLKLKADKWFYQLKDVLEERKEHNNDGE